MTSHEPALGATQNEIDTPALLLDRSLLAGNIRAMAAITAPLHTRLRPHFKTHKCVEIARMQLAEGATGIACAKLGEAEVLAAGGVQDILVTSPIVGPQKISRLVSLARQCAMATVVDDAENVEQLSQSMAKAGATIRCLVELNVGMNRCGVDAPAEALQLAEIIDASQSLTFGGIQAYEGHLRSVLPLSERAARVEADLTKALEAKNVIEARGIPVRTITGGSTGTFRYVADLPWISEVQPGSYATMDVQYRSVHVEGFSNALTVLTSVISRRNASTAIVDAGFKAVSPEFGPPDVLVEGAKFTEFTEEQGAISFDPPNPELRIGDKIELMPAHGCTTVNLYDVFHVMENHRLVAIWPVAARGRSQ